MIDESLAELYKKAQNAPVRLVHYEDFPCKERKHGFFSEFIQEVTCCDCLMKMSRGSA